MPALLPQPDPEGLLEYSVVYTDRALNHMSQRFQGVMKDISRILKTVYNAKSAVVVPAAAPSAWKPWRASSSRSCASRMRIGEVRVSIGAPASAGGAMILGGTRGLLTFRLPITLARP